MLYPPKIHVEALIFNLMVFRGVTFGRKLDHEGGALMIGLVPLDARGVISLLPSEDALRNLLSTSQEVGSHQTWNLPAP